MVIKQTFDSRCDIRIRNTHHAVTKQDTLAPHTSNESNCYFKVKQSSTSKSELTETIWICFSEKYSSWSKTIQNEIWTCILRTKQETWDIEGKLQCMYVLRLSLCDKRKRCNDLWPNILKFQPFMHQPTKAWCTHTQYSQIWKFHGEFTPESIIDIQSGTVITRSNSSEHC